MSVRIINADSSSNLDFYIENQSIDCIFTSPNPYGCNCGSSIGSEKSQQEYLDNLVNVFTLPDKGVKSKLKKDGSLFVHMQDFYDTDQKMLRTPEKFMAMMTTRGWKLKGKLTWRKLQDSDWTSRRLFANDCDTIYWFTQTDDYYFNHNVPYRESSLIETEQGSTEVGKFESGFPEEVIRKAIAPTTREGDVVCDPFCGTAITGVVALQMNRRFIGIDIKGDLIPLIHKRLETGVYA
jgi:DNA modification methylase